VASRPPGVSQEGAATARCGRENVEAAPGRAASWSLLDAQYRYVFHAKHQSAASWVEALALDVGMAIF
jgi:hypothetical protein